MGRKSEKEKDWFIMTLVINQDCFSQGYCLHYPYSWFSFTVF